MILTKNHEKNEIDVEEIKRILPFPVEVLYNFNTLVVLGDYYEFIRESGGNSESEYIRYYNVERGNDDKNFFDYLLKTEQYKDDKWLKILSETKIELLSALYKRNQVPHEWYKQFVDSLKNVEQVHIENKSVQIYFYPPHNGSVYIDFCKKKYFYICYTQLDLQNMSDENKKVLSEFLGMNLHKIKTKNVTITTWRPKRIFPSVIEAINRFQGDEKITEIDLDFPSKKLTISTKNGRKSEFIVCSNYLIPDKTDLYVFQKVSDLVPYKDFFEFLIREGISYNMKYEQVSKSGVIPFLLKFLEKQKTNPKYINVLVGERWITVYMNYRVLATYEGIEVNILHGNKPLVDVSPFIDSKVFIRLFILSPNEYIFIFPRQNKEETENKTIDKINEFLKGAIDKSSILENYEGVINSNNKKYCIIYDYRREEIIILPKAILPYFLRTLRRYLFPLF